MKKYYIMPLLILISMACHAENWKKISPFYFDLDSRERKGDVASMTAKENMAGAKFTIYFDCANKEFYAYGWKKSIPFDLNPETAEFSNIACKRSWRIWK